MSQKPDSFSRLNAGLDFSPAARHTSAHLENMLEALKEQRGQFCNDGASQDNEHTRLAREFGHHASHLTRLEREFEQLRSSTCQRFQQPGGQGQDPLFQTTPSVNVNMKARNEIGLRDLVEREIQALDKTASRGRSESVNRRCHRSQSLDPAPYYAVPQPIPERHMMSTMPRPAGMGQRSDLYQELEDMDMALKKACEDNIRLTEEKDACKAAHERDVKALESMLKSVMEENKQLKEALATAIGNTSPKYASRGMPEELERAVISNLIHGGISHIPQTPNSQGSSSTQTPPFEPEAEDGSLDLSRASIDMSRAATPLNSAHFSP